MNDELLKQIEYQAELLQLDEGKKKLFLSTCQWIYSCGKVEGEEIILAIIKGKK